MSRKLAKVTRKASTTQIRPDWLKCRSRWMAGRATLTIEASREFMNMPRHTTTRAHHRRRPVRAVHRWAGWRGHRPGSSSPRVGASNRRAFGQVGPRTTGWAPMTDPGCRRAAPIASDHRRWHTAPVHDEGSGGPGWRVLVVPLALTAVLLTACASISGRDSTTSSPSAAARSPTTPTTPPPVPVSPPCPPPNDWTCLFPPPPPPGFPLVPPPPHRHPPRRARPRCEPGQRHQHPGSGILGAGPSRTCGGGPPPPHCDQRGFGSGGRRPPPPPSRPRERRPLIGGWPPPRPPN